MTDDPMMPLPKPPSEEPAETMRPVRPITTGGETEAISPGTDAVGAAELKVSSRRIKVRKLGPYELLGMLGRGGMRLAKLDCANNSISSLAPLKEMPLQSLNCCYNPITDLTPL